MEPTPKTSSSSVIEEALRYEAMGFSVIPLGKIEKINQDRKKINYPIEWKKFQSIRATIEEIKSWNYPNIGIITGEVSDLLVLDLDRYKETYDRELEQSLGLPITPTVRTANDGLQLYFKRPKGISFRNDVCIGHKGSGIDIRAEGGMVIAPPSTTSYGEYVWEIDPFTTPLAEVPPNLLVLLKVKDEEIKPKKQLNDLVGLKEGEGRNNAMASFVGKTLLTMHPDNWAVEGWNEAKKLNDTFMPPLDKQELSKVFNSILKIEWERRSNLPNKEQERKVKHIPTNSISHSELISKKFPPMRYSIEPFFEIGTLNMISAPPNSWKSWQLFLDACHIALGTKVFGIFATEQANVMIVNEEDSERLVQDRLRLLKVTDPNIPIFYRIANGSKLTEEFIDELIAEAKEKNIGVIMFDSLRAIHSADENNSTEMQVVLDLLKKIVREEITVIFTHHHRKKTLGKGNDDAEATRGSSAINAAISGHISLEEITREDGKFLVVRHLKSKVGEKLPPFELEVKTEESVVWFEYMGEHKPNDRALSETKEKILVELNSRSELLGRKDLVALKVGGQTSVKEATKFLVKEGQIEEIARRYALSKGLNMFNPEGKLNEKLYRIKKDLEVEFNEMYEQANQ